MDTFGEQLKWFRIRAGLDQKPLADLLGVHRNTIVAWENSQYLPRHSDVVEVLAKELYLAEVETNQLLAAAHYPAKYHIPHGAISPPPAEPPANLPPPHQGTPAFTQAEQTAARTKYLEGVCQRYSTVTLPIGPAEGFSLQAIFQPLKLRRDPLAAEDLVYEERRALLGEARGQYDCLQRAGRGVEQTEVLADHGEDALHKSPQGRMVVLGGPGTGKTTLLMDLVGNQAQKALTEASMSVPVFLSLPDLARSGKPLQDYLLSLTKDCRVDDRYALVLWKAIEEGHAFLCLDSLDEVPPRQRPEMIRLVNELASCPGNTWVVGSRFTEYKGGQFKRGQFAEWELQSMSHDLRHLLAQRLLPELHRLLSGKNTLSEDESLVFVRTLESHPQAAVWGENPLLFSLAAVIFARTGALPSSRAALYQQVTDAIFETREKDPTRRKMLRRVVADLALDLYQTKGRTFTHEDIVLLLPSIRQRQLENWSTEEMTNSIITSGILDVVAQETYGFRHQTFQEYLAAVALTQRLVSQHQEIREEGWSFAWSKRTYSRWTEILRLMVGVLVQNHRKEGARQARRWLHKLVRQQAGPEGDPGHLRLALALTSLAEVSGARVGAWKEVGGEEVEEEIVVRWIATFLGEHSLQEQRRYRPFPVWELGRLHLSERAMKEAVGRLLTALNDTDARVRVRAVQALGMVGEHLPVEPLLAVLHDTHNKVRNATVLVLGNRGERVPVESLLTVLGDEDSSVRGTAEHVLAARGEHAPVEQLRQALNAEEWRRRASAAKVLAHLNVRVAVEPFLAELKEKDARRRTEALWVLGELGEDVPIEPLLVALSDKDFNVQLAATTALGKHKTRVPLEPFLSDLRDESSLVRRKALVVLEGLGSRAPVEPLVAALQDEDSLVRQMAAEALTRVGEHAPVEPLVAALQDEDSLVRRMAAKALALLGERVPLEAWRVALHNEDVDVCASAMAALWRRGERTQVESRLTSSSDHSHFKWMRIAAVEFLGHLGEHAPVEPLVAALQDEHWPVRAAAAWALRKLKERAPVESLVAALQDEHGYVREVAVQVLGQLGGRVPVEPLEAALGDEYVPVRAAAIWVLRGLGKLDLPTDMRLSGSASPDKPFRYKVEKGSWNEYWSGQEKLDGEQMGEHTPVEQLLRALQNERGDVRKQAEQALEHRAEHGPVEPLLKALPDQEIAVRAAIVKALGKSGASAPIELLVSILKQEHGQVRVAAAEALGQLGECTPVEPLVAALHDSSGQVRHVAVQALGRLGGRVPVEPLVAALGDSEEGVRRAAAQALQQTHPDALLPVVHDAIAILQGKESGMVLGSIAQGFIAQTIGHLEHASPVLLEKLTQLLDWPHWQVRMEAAQALGNLRRSILDAAIRRLFELRYDPQSQVVREVANDALAQILSLETGIEDD